MTKRFSSSHTFSDDTPESEMTPGHTLPPESYTDPAIYAEEIEKIFRQNWIPVCRSTDIPDPGSYRAIDLFGEPVVITRGKDNIVRMLSNVCRHRNAVMLDGDGTTPMIRCPYHHWIYDLEGNLRAAPHMDRVPEFEESQCPLPQYLAEEWNGFVMVNFDTGATPFAEQYPDLTDMLADIDTPSAQQVAQLDYPATWNWKVMVENFIESYHVSATHPKTLQPYWSTQSSFLADTDEGYIHLKHSVDPKLGAQDIFVIPPFFLLAVQRPSNIVLWFDFTLNTVDQFDLSIRILNPKSNKLPFWEKIILKKHAEMVHREDMKACAAVQRGVASRDAATGPLSTLERTVRKFQDFWHQHMGDDA